MKKIYHRATRPTPRFFKILRTTGLALAGISTAILTAPVALPAILTATAGYLAVAGGVIVAVSQVTVKNDQ